ncbi:MAG TPA: YihY/virulence factor BrkB family protein [Ktedonobacterales bacterium]
MRQNGQRPSVRQDGMASSAKHEVKKATSFWTKISEDWMLNFSGMLAYNYLTAIAPILLALLAISGLALGALSPGTYQSFVNGLSGHFPAGAGHSFVTGALAALRRSAGALLIIAIVTAVFSGSRLFVALDNVFAVIFRVDVRPFLKQNIMAVLMMLLFLVLAPLAFFASSVPGAVLSNVLPSGIQSNVVVLTVEGFVGGVVVAFILFGVIYYVVPNTRQRWATTWPGALATAVLLNLYEVLFPIYQRLFLKSAGLGSAAGLAVVILIFLYYIGVITLLGAEINAWASGLRPLGATLPQLFRNQRQAGNGNTPEAQASDLRSGSRQAEQPERAESPVKSLTNRLAALLRAPSRPPSDDHAVPST